jgi:hypothetical protein
MGWFLSMQRAIVREQPLLLSGRLARAVKRGDPREQSRRTAIAADDRAQQVLLPQLGACVVGRRGGIGILGDDAVARARVDCAGGARKRYAAGRGSQTGVAFDGVQHCRQRGGLGRELGFRASHRANACGPVDLPTGGGLNARGECANRVRHLLPDGGLRIPAEPGVRNEQVDSAGSQPAT